MIRNVAAEAGMKEATPGAGTVFVDRDGMIIWPVDHAEKIIAAVNAAFGSDAERLTIQRKARAEVLRELAASVRSDPGKLFPPGLDDNQWDDIYEWLQGKATEEEKKI